MIVLTTNYADWKLIVNNAMTSPKVAFCPLATQWTAWAISNELLAVGRFGTLPGTFNTDFPTAAQLNVMLQTQIG